MNLSDQVCSLKTAKRLKELGVRQESLFFYQNQPYDDGEDEMNILITEVRHENNGNSIMNTYDKEEFEDQPTYSAFTVAELGEMLPFQIKVKGKSYYYSVGQISPANQYMPRHEVNYSYGDECIYLEREDTEANARAKMLIYLLENKLINLKQ